MSEPTEPRMYGVLNTNYTRLVLPMEIWSQVMDLLAQAEKLDHSDYQNPKIVPLKGNSFDISVLSASEYKEMKVMSLLNQV